jgi:hypothetical protein
MAMVPGLFIADKIHLPEMYCRQGHIMSNRELYLLFYFEQPKGTGKSRGALVRARWKDGRRAVSHPV